MNYFGSKTVSRVVGVSLRQIQYWDEQGFIHPSIRPASGRGTKRVYSFSDLVKLKVVKNLSDHGLSVRSIRRCLLYLKNYSSSGESPASSLKYLTDGKKIFVLTDNRNKILDALDRQFVFSLAIGNLVQELNGEVRRLEGREKPGPRISPIARRRAVALRRRG